MDMKGHMGPEISVTFLASGIAGMVALGAVITIGSGGADAVGNDPLDSIGRDIQAVCDSAGTKDIITDLEENQQVRAEGSELILEEGEQEEEVSTYQIERCDVRILGEQTVMDGTSYRAEEDDGTVKVEPHD